MYSVGIYLIFLAVYFIGHFYFEIWNPSIILVEFLISTVIVVFLLYGKLEEVLWGKAVAASYFPPVEESLSYFGTPGGICPKIICCLTLKNSMGFDKIKKNKGVVGTQVRQYQHTGLIPGIA